MEVFRAIKGRRSIRSYTSECISEDDLYKVLDAARWAPSAGNCQPWEFIVVKDRELKRYLCKAALEQSFIEEASVVIVVCANEMRSIRFYGNRGRNFYCLLDVAAAVQSMLLAAYALGLGTCWVGAFDEVMTVKILNIPLGVRPVAIVPIGYPNEVPRPPTRIKLNDLVHSNQYPIQSLG